MDSTNSTGERIAMNTEESKKLLRLKTGYNQHTMPTLNCEVFCALRTTSIAGFKALPQGSPQTLMSLLNRWRSLSSE